MSGVYYVAIGNDNNTAVHHLDPRPGASFFSPRQPLNSTRVASFKVSKFFFLRKTKILTDKWSIIWLTELYSYHCLGKTLPSHVQGRLCASDLFLTIFTLSQSDYVFYANRIKCRKLALVGIIPDRIFFSFSSDKDRRTDSRTRRKNTAARTAPPGIKPRVLRILVAHSNRAFGLLHRQKVETFDALSCWKHGENNNDVPAKKVRCYRCLPPPPPPYLCEEKFDL